MKPGRKEKQRTEDAPERVPCYVCGAEICCEPARVDKAEWRTLICGTCGKSVLAETLRPLAARCCGRGMLLYPGEFW